MDSMVGYRNKRYEKFGKVAAKLDDIANFIPSRLTALLIMLFGKHKQLFAFYQDGKKHESPNAGHPITAMALVLGVKLGGDTAYFGKIKKKPYFGYGKKHIKAEDVIRAVNYPTTKQI
jgi:adenosylcobinamide-phosphate synthase